jgi:hypothetical protein
MPRSGATGISRRLTVIAVGGVLIVAAVGASSVADSGLTTGPAPAVVRTADVFFQPGVAKQALIMEKARAAEAYAESVEAAGARQAAVRAARAAATRAAAKRAAAARAGAARAARAAASRQAASERAARPQPAPPAKPQPPAGSPQQIAQQLLGQYGWAGQFSCLNSLWTLESGWNIYAENPTTGAYGIPQALPGDKMASAGPDWQSDPTTQIRWGLDYIQATYGSPCAAWSHEEADGWY